jgi:hypothetical protein
VTEVPAFRASWRMMMRIEITPPVPPTGTRVHLPMFGEVYTWNKVCCAMLH